MFDEEAQGATIRIGHLIEGDTHPLDRSIIGDTWPERFVGLLRDQWGGQFAKELLMQAGYRVYIICLQIARIVELRQLTLQLFHQQLIARGPIQSILFDGIGLFDLIAHIDNESGHIRMIFHIQIEFIEWGTEEWIVDIPLAVAFRLLVALGGVWVMFAVAERERKVNRIIESIGIYR